MDATMMRVNREKRRTYALPVSFRGTPLWSVSDVDIALTSLPVGKAKEPPALISINQRESHLGLAGVRFGRDHEECCARAHQGPGPVKVPLHGVDLEVRRRQEIHHFSLHQEAWIRTRVVQISDVPAVPTPS